MSAYKVKAADGTIIEIPDGEYFITVKARTRRLMLNSLTSDARRVYACLELATMGFQQELAVTMANGKQRPLTPGDIAHQTGLSNQHVRRGLADLEDAGLAKREADDGKKLRQGHVLIYSWAYPQSTADDQTSSRARLLVDWFPESWEAFRPLINRFKLKLIPDEAAARGYFAEGERIARSYLEAEQVAVRFLESVCAQPRLNKEERNERKIERKIDGRTDTTPASNTVESPNAAASVRPSVSSSFQDDLKPKLRTFLLSNSPVPSPLDEDMLTRICAEIHSETAYELFQRKCEEVKGTAQKWAFYVKLARDANIRAGTFHEGSTAKPLTKHERMKQEFLEKYNGKSATA